ncbi:MAG: oligosaccharyl transferase, archaeosortase A system-associated [Dehalococcoidia bacterium]|nr:MAG: oligosaccharyl transferase, archaeosortase A system-associated [Dehalococcoidia bacterium]
MTSGDELIKREWLSPQFVSGILLAVFFGVALFFRIAIPYDQVFRGDTIKFTTADAYHYMRLVDSLAHNFPSIIPFDPYLSYPQVFDLGSQNLFVFLLSGIAWLIGLGSPTQHTVDIIGAYFPAIMGALTVFPVFFIGKALFNRWAGVIAAGLIAVYPGEFMGRTALGFADRDGLQVLFTALTMLFLILAIKSARQRQLSFSHLRNRDWAVITGPLAYSLLAGIFLGLYLLTWTGAFLFLIVIFVYFIIQYIVSHLRQENNDYLGFTGTIIFLIALVMFLPASRNELFLGPLLVALLIPPVLSGISRMMVKKRMKPAYYLLVLVGFGIAGLIIFQVVNPSLLKSILGYLVRNFVQPAQELTTAENAPILFPFGEFSLELIWLQFTTSVFLSLISLGVLTYLTIKKREAEKTLLLVWSLILLVFTLAMRRFAVFLAVNVALLTGYLSWLALRYAIPKQKAVAPSNAEKKMKGKRVKSSSVQKTGASAGKKLVRPGLALAVIFFVVFFPNIGYAINDAGQAYFASSDAWGESLSWLRDNSPEPFGNPDFYYEYYKMPFEYPRTAYAVLSWWDYGYEIIRTGHRLPNTNPGGGARGEAGRFFTSQDETFAGEIADLLNSRYVIVDDKMVTGMFHAMATYAGSSYAEFFDYYYVRQNNAVVRVVAYYPEYYRSLAVRLYAFDGARVVPKSTFVISYRHETFQDGSRYKVIENTESFSSYEDAAAYIQRQPSGNYRIVGNDPFISPVPLEALEDYRLIYSAKSDPFQSEAGTIPRVKIFEYAK